MPKKYSVSGHQQNDAVLRKRFLTHLKKLGTSCPADIRKSLRDLCSENKKRVTLRARKSVSEDTDIRFKGLALFGWNASDFLLLFQAVSFHRIRRFCITDRCTLRPNPEHEGKKVFSWTVPYKDGTELFLFTGSRFEQLSSPRWLQTSLAIHLLFAIARSSEEGFDSAMEHVLGSKGKAWSHRFCSSCAPKSSFPLPELLRILYLSPVSVSDSDWKQGFVRVLSGTYSLSDTDAEIAGAVLERFFTEAGIRYDIRNAILLFQQQILKLTFSLRKHFLSQFIAGYASRPGLHPFLKRFVEAVFVSESSLIPEAFIDSGVDSEMDAVLRTLEWTACACTSPDSTPDFSHLPTALRILNRRWPGMSHAERHTLFALIHNV